MLAQEIEERGARIDGERPRIAIDSQCDSDAFWSTACGLVGRMLIDPHPLSHIVRPKQAPRQSQIRYSCLWCSLSSFGLRGIRL